MNEYRVTIVMGIYNCEETLEEAIQSIIMQTYKEWKLIMCDDASTDNTLHIANKYAQVYENIIVLHNKKNMGLNYTLNKCLKYVDTEYYARMDGDDISLSTRIEKEVLFLDEHQEYDIVSTNMAYFDENGDWGKGTVKERPKKEDFVYGTPFCHAPCMIRTNAIKSVGGYTVDVRLLRVEDYHLWYKLYLSGYKGYNINEILYKMRDDRKAISRRKFKYRLNEAYVKYLIVKDFKLSIKMWIHIVRPIIVGIFPKFLYKYLHKRRLIKND